MQRKNDMAIGRWRGTRAFVEQKESVSTASGMQHLTFELYGCTPALLRNAKALRDTLEAYVALINMEKAAGPFVYEMKIDNSPDVVQGLSGFVIINTSHICISTHPDTGEVYVDVFSCDAFDEEDAVKFAQQEFGSSDVEVHSVQRATRSPRTL